MRRENEENLSDELDLIDEEQVDRECFAAEADEEAEGPFPAYGDAEQDKAQDPQLARDGLRAYLRDIGRSQILSQEEVLALTARIRQGDEKAREQMIASNLRLVVSIAKRYQNLGLDLPDLK